MTDQVGEQTKKPMNQVELYMDLTAASSDENFDILSDFSGENYNRKSKAQKLDSQPDHSDLSLFKAHRPQNNFKLAFDGFKTLVFEKKISNVTFSEENSPNLACILD